MAVFPFAGEENAFPWDGDAVEKHHRGGLPVLAREERLAVFQLFARAARRAGHDGDPGRIHAHRTAHGEFRILAPHVPTGHDEELVHVGCAGDDGLGAADDDALGVAFHDVDVGVRVRLLVRLPAAVALGVGHGDAQGQVLVLDMGQVGVKAGTVLRAAFRVVDPGHGLGDAVERVVRQVALGATRFLAQHPHRLQLVQQVSGRFVHMEHAADHAVAARLGRQGDGFQLGPQRVVVRECERIDARLKGGLVGNAGNFAAIDIDRGPIAAQRFPVGLARHQVGFCRRGCGCRGRCGHGWTPWIERCADQLNTVQ